ncbi:hypothetical protein BV20DRAFT_856447 [Pilatotrama ljubarskyi]|nr:hypothetical protein BV20DRAFT_168297 [Pilatotrama ljubarskyi]KAI0364534.1 hypothetical protein BV20DRAFT_856447 [Pilatotrama ljubarskyi]
MQCERCTVRRGISGKTALRRDGGPYATCELGKACREARRMCNESARGWESRVCRRAWGAGMREGRDEKVVCRRCTIIGSVGVHTSAAAGHRKRREDK